MSKQEKSHQTEIVYNKKARFQYVIEKEWEVGLSLEGWDTFSQPDPLRNRKLLVHDHEFKQWVGYVEREGYTLIPLSLYWKGKWIKVKIGLAKGKKTHDQRASIKEREWQRDRERIMKKQQY